MRLLCGRVPLTWHKGRSSALLDQAFRMGLHKPCWPCLELARDICSEQDARLQDFLIDGISVTAPGHREKLAPDHNQGQHKLISTEGGRSPSNPGKGGFFLELPRDTSASFSHSLCLQQLVQPGETRGAQLDFQQG